MFKYGGLSKDNISLNIVVIGKVTMNKNLKEVRGST